MERVTPTTTPPPPPKKKKTGARVRRTRVRPYHQMLCTPNYQRLSSGLHKLSSVYHYRNVMTLFFLLDKRKDTARLFFFVNSHEKWEERSSTLISYPGNKTKQTQTKKNGTNKGKKKREKKWDQTGRSFLFLTTAVNWQRVQQDLV